ncbi:MAG: hypothetical protein WA110_00710, partial [Anaerolineaceae bacterium]
FLHLTQTLSASEPHVTAIMIIKTAFIGNQTHKRTNKCIYCQLKMIKRVVFSQKKFRCNCPAGITQQHHFEENLFFQVVVAMKPGGV